ncbi:MAG: copper chaperone PCu(A)C [Pseudomonadota bacterium]
MKKTIIALVALAALCADACAQVSASGAWIRATVPQQKATGAFMRLTASADTRLLSVQSPVAGNAEIHQMQMKGDMMTMRAVEGIDLPAGKPVDLASGGYHIMLLDLKRALKDGESVPLTLAFMGKDKKRSSITLQVPVKPLSYTAAPLR